MHLEVSRVVMAPEDRVYAVYTDFEAQPKWSKRLTSVKVVKREAATVILESHGTSSKGTERTRTGPVALLPKRVESESETRFTRTRRTVTFVAQPEGGTKVTATLDVEVKGMWRLVLRTSAREAQAEASAQEELSSFARYVESLPS